MFNFTNYSDLDAFYIIDYISHDSNLFLPRRDENV